MRNAHARTRRRRGRLRPRTRRHASCGRGCLQHAGWVCRVDRVVLSTGVYALMLGLSVAVARRDTGPMLAAWPSWIAYVSEYSLLAYYESVPAWPDRGRVVARSHQTVAAARTRRLRD